MRWILYTHDFLPIYTIFLIVIWDETVQDKIETEIAIQFWQVKLFMLYNT